MITRTLRNLKGNILELLNLDKKIEEVYIREKYQISEEKYKFIFNSGNDSIFFHEYAGNFVEVNDVACRRLGYSREELLHMKTTDIDASKPSTELIESLLKQGYFVAEVVHRCKDGSLLPMELSSRILEIHGNKMVLTFARDISERKNNEALLKENHLQLEEAYRESKQKEVRISAMNEIVRTINYTLDFKESLHTFAIQAAKLISFDEMGISLFGEEHQLSLYPISWSKGCLSLGDVIILSDQTEPFHTILQSREPVIKDNRCLGIKNFYQGETGELRTNAPIMSCVILPLNYKGDIIGTFSLGSNQKQQYHDSDLEILISLGEHLAVAIENALLHEKAKELAVSIERTRIAREIHDTSVQAFSYFRVKGEFIEKMLKNKMQEESIKAAREIQVIAIEAYDEAREAIHALSDKIPKGENLITYVQKYLVKISNRWGIITEFSTSNDFPTLERTLELQLQRIIQEALANVHKHAEAEHVWVRFVARNGGILIEIEDDGKGFDICALPSCTFGLSSIKERAEDIDGRLIIDSKKGFGTRLSIWIPVVI
ncbi:PAS domain S-box protein [Desulfosporosinus shakirovi]|uniref:PAS domain S-box protein n=1 Tax=Desulfosporosinus shakirovi TaxID=2885154 RepID=UPI001E3EAC3C|nr:PAS domain S-box protein [Desulfosporosinus sp. SRJS8]MCB8814939.1 PAS domain S-box protein [Desulfosporosinus sp. SRJS8]